ncbi:MAG: carboxymuconolactone decarboxylase family protein [Candidatus Izemoplasmataceae bacterium]
MNNNKERVFKVSEFLSIIQLARIAFPTMRDAKKRKAFSKQLKERIMLAVTNVNGCALCSFVHTKIALKSGLEASEIKALLGGEKDQVREEDLIAILFAEHFAYSKESPDKEALDRLVDYYGDERANLILASTVMISLTNVIGITLNLFKKRLMFKRDKRSSFLSEIAILLLIPYAGIQLMLGQLFKRNKRQKLVAKFV